MVYIHLTHRRVFLGVGQTLSRNGDGKRDGRFEEGEREKEG